MTTLFHRAEAVPSAPIRIRKESVTDNVGAGRYTIGTVYPSPLKQRHHPLPPAMSFEKTVKLACKPKNAPPKSKVSPPSPPLIPMLIPS